MAKKFSSLEIAFTEFGKLSNLHIDGASDSFLERTFVGSCKHYILNIDGSFDDEF